MKPTAWPLCWVRGEAGPEAGGGRWDKILAEKGHRLYEFNVRRQVLPLVRNPLVTLTKFSA